MLTSREQQIVDLLRRDPLMSAEALATALGTTRASVNVHVSNLGKKGVILGRGYVLADSPAAVVVGGANMDFKARSRARATPQTSNPGHGSMAPGGVARNIAENLARLGDRVHLVSVVGRDPLGETLLRQTVAAGVRVEHVTRTERPTGTYTAVLDADGELIVAIADMEATSEIGPELVGSARDLIASAGVLVLDGNLSRATLDHVLDLSSGVRTIFEPVSVPKASGLKDAVDDRVYAVTPNRDELTALTDLPARTDRQVRRAISALHARGVELVWVRLGDRGSLLATMEETIEIPALPASVEDVTGAGDAMLAAFCHILLAGGTPQHAAHFGHAAAALTIASPHTVRPDLTPRLVQATLDAATDLRDTP
ncbi:carbohydrate kinase [Nocardioides sp.]|uniref:carbohydrate kinase family protein n=1 Tax=Nocardioides sp. TaxID=35761 RepID=UPI002B572708|nr:carbohydrate kinase [Nocardioides sp.]HXH80975.1 carbohydrate kinase [Nocardioides sp.]